MTATHSRPEIRRSAGFALGAASVAALGWLASLVRGRVPLDYLGDESARLLRSYGAVGPRDAWRVLTDTDSWTAIHPVGDVLFKGLVNTLFQPVLDRPSQYVILHQVVAWMCVTVGVAFFVRGVWWRWGPTSAAVFACLAVSSSPVIYIAHHTVGEAVAVLLVGFSAWLVLARQPATAIHVLGMALPVFLAGMVRPEAGVVFAVLAAVFLVEHRWRLAALYGAVCLAPMVLVTLTIELSSNNETYANIRRFPRVAFFDVVTSERMREIIWGLGVVPYLTIAVVVLAAYRWRRRGVSLGVVLAAGWFAVALLFTQQIAVGAVHQQERAYVFPALLGMLALTALLGERPSGRLERRLVLGGSVALVALNVITVHGTTYGDWSDRVPTESVQVSAFLNENSGSGDSVLLDWMWWQEWRAAVYASAPGLPGLYCTYLDCLVEPDATLATTIPSGYDGDPDRLVRAATFLRDQQPEHIVMFSSERYDDWLSWRRDQKPFPSFVRPLLQEEGDCFHVVPTLGSTRYCPVLENDFYLVLERAESDDR